MMAQYTDTLLMGAGHRATGFFSLSCPCCGECNSIFSCLHQKWNCLTCGLLYTHEEAPATATVWEGEEEEYEGGF